MRVVFGESHSTLSPAGHQFLISRWSRRLLVVTGARCPLTKPVVTAVQLRVDHRAPLQPWRAARRYLRRCGTPRADSPGSGVGLAPGPQALPMPAAALVLYITRASRVVPLAIVRQQRMRQDFVAEAGATSCAVIQAKSQKQLEWYRDWPWGSAVRF
jgi:hypothetical protein